MWIGELSQRTQTSRRLLRYYEEQGLIGSAREANGYRSYDEALVDRVLQIRGLLDAGLPTRIIKQILPCLTGSRTLVFDDATPEILAALERERDRMTERIACLARNRDAVSGYLAEIRDLRRRAAAGRTEPGSALVGGDDHADDDRGGEHHPGDRVGEVQRAAEADPLGYEDAPVVPVDVELAQLPVTVVVIPAHHTHLRSQSR